MKNIFQVDIDFKMATNRKQFSLEEARRIIFNNDSEESSDDADVSDDNSNISENDPTAAESDEDDEGDAANDNHDDMVDSGEKSAGETEGYSDNGGYSDDADVVHTLLSKDKKTVWNTESVRAWQSWSDALQQKK